MAHRVEIFDRVKQAHAKLLEGYSCTAVVTQLAESKGLSRRTAQRTVQQAYALIREDIDQCNVDIALGILYDFCGFSYFDT